MHRDASQTDVRTGDDTLRQDEAEQEASRELSRRPLNMPGAIPGYEVLTILGEGSFGSVWLARELKTGKQVAIKFYTHRRGLDWSLLTREVEKLAVLYTSRNVVGLLDVGWDHDPPYFVMEYLEHGSLASRLEGGALPVEGAVGIAKALAKALVHAHGSGILHCDLKPANVLLDAGDEPRLGDFGQSRLTTEQSPALGTLFYMAPEQADLSAVPDARWDVYALGALLYQMLTGSPPHHTPQVEARIRSAETLEDRLAAYRAVIAASPRPDAHRKRSGVDKRLAEIIDGCLETDPAKRIANAQIVYDRLEQRDKSRARRPLIVLGFLGPILFLLAMFWIAQTAVPNAVATAERNLVDRALAGDSVSALILADAIRRDLADRREHLEDLSQRDEVREIARVTAANSDISNAELIALIESRAQEHPAAAAFAALARERQVSDGRLKQERRTEDQSWLVQDRFGRQVFRWPSRKPNGDPQPTIGDDYHWRRYFTGEDADSPRDAPVGLPPIRTRSGVTSAFRSEATNQYMVAIAVPVWDEERREVIGVLARTIHIADLLKQWENTIRDPESPAGRNDRFLALANVKSKAGGGHETTLLDHPWMTVANLSAVAGSDKELDALMSQLRLSDGTTEQLQALVSGERRDYRDAEYSDPTGERDAAFAGPWLAAFAPVSGSSWVAIVQERRPTAVEPVQEVRQVFQRAGVVAVLVFGALLAVLWYFLNRASMRT